MKKQNKWREFSHIHRSVGRRPGLEEFHYFMSGGLILRPETRIYQKPLPEIKKDCPNANLLAALLDNRPKLDEQEMTCKNLREKLSNLTIEQQIILLKRKRYELAYLANIMNTLAFETDFIKGNIQVHQVSTPVLYPFNYYGGRSHSVTKIYKKEREREEKRSRVRKENNAILEQAEKLVAQKLLMKLSEYNNG